MASYDLAWKRSAEKELRALPKEIVPRLVELAESLRENPIPRGARKLTGGDRTYRLRVGDYRMVYTLERDRLVVEVVRIAHRRNAYR